MEDLAVQTIFMTLLRCGDKPEKTELALYRSPETFEVKVFGNELPNYEVAALFRRVADELEFQSAEQEQLQFEFDERAAIYELEGGFNRKRAEDMALEYIFR